MSWREHRAAVAVGFLVSIVSLAAAMGLEGAFGAPSLAPPLWMIVAGCVGMGCALPGLFVTLVMARAAVPTRLNDGPEKSQTERSQANGEPDGQ